MTEKKKVQRGGPPPKGLENRKESGTLCTARRKNGLPCSNYSLNGATVCRMHGGAAPQVRAAAQVRILMASDLAAKKLIELMTSPKVDERVKLAAAKDLLDRANLAGTQNIEIGVTPKKTFEDFVGEALIDVELDEDEPLDYKAITPAPATQEDSNIVDAEVVDDVERWEREDEARERAKERQRMQRGTPANPATQRQPEAGLRKKPAPAVRKTSTADPYADRYEDPKQRRTMSPKRWEEHQKGRRNG